MPLLTKNFFGSLTVDELETEQNLLAADVSPNSISVLSTDYNGSYWFVFLELLSVIRVGQVVKSLL